MIPRGSAPSNEYNNPPLLLGLYPTLFPYGTGAFEESPRPVKTSFKSKFSIYFPTTIVDLKNIILLYLLSSICYNDEKPVFMRD